jgi:PKD-like domain
VWLEGQQHLHLRKAQQAVVPPFTLGAGDLTSTISACGIVGGGGQNDMDIASGDPGGSSTYQWQVSLDNGTTWSNAAGPTATTTQFVLDPLYTTFEANAGVYLIRVAITNNGCTGTSGNATLTVTGSSNLTAGSISANQIFCTSGNPSILNSVTSPSGGTGTYSYKWQSSTDNISFSTISGATSSTYDPPSITQTTYYRRAVISGGCSAYSNVITATIFTTVPAAPGSISGSSIVCANTPGLSYSISSVANATTYTWSVPSGWTITSGSGTTAIVVTAGTSAVSGSISVTAGNPCGTSSSSNLAVLVNASPTVSGASSVCVGSNITLSPTTGGTWASSNNAIATVTNSGVVNGVASGSAILTFTQSLTGCSNTTAVTVNALPTTYSITGGGSYCTGGSGVAIGVSSSDNGTTYQLYRGATLVSTRSGTGAAVSFGNSIISGTYTVLATTGAGCTATMSGSATVSVNSLPQVSAFSGNSMCTYATGQLTVSASSGTGPFSVIYNNGSTNQTASGVSSGTAFNASPNPAVTTNYSLVSVTDNNGCVRSSSFTDGAATITLLATPADETISAASSAVCSGGATNIQVSTSQLGVNYQLRNNTGNVNIGSAVAGTGSAIDLSTGTLSSTTTFNVLATNTSTSCNVQMSSTVTVTANALPTLGGASSVCVGSTAVLSPATGGTWASNNTAIASIIPTSGSVTGVAAGTVTFTYTQTSTGCSNTTASFTVNAKPTVNALTGASTICVGLTTTYSSTTPGGTFSSANGAVATVHPTAGVITGAGNGSTNIFYSVTNGSGCTTIIFKVVSVNANPVVSALTGTNTVCVGSNTTFSSTTSGGIFSSNNTSAATVHPTSGLITGVAAGTATISYAVTNSSTCTTTVTRDVTVNATPVVSALTGTNTVCVGSNTTFSSTTAGGTFSSSNTAAATVNASSGVITGIAAGTATISYAVTNSNGCVTTVTRGITIYALPTDKSLSAVSATICSGTSATIQVALSQSGVNYQLRNNATNTNIGSVVAGNGGTISLPSAALSGTITFNVLAINATTSCSVQMSATLTVTVSPSGQWIGGASGDWNVSGNWCGGVPTSSTNVVIPSGSAVNIQSANAVTNSVTVNAGGSLVMTGANNLTISAAGNFTNNGTFTASGSTGAVIFSGSGIISGTTTFNNIDTYGQLDFGSSSTVSGTFTLQPGGSVTGNSPGYTCPSATLLYNTTGTFLRGLEWTSTSSGSGCPSNVTIDNNTVINFPVAGDGYICNDLNIKNGSSLRQDYSGGSASLKVGRHVTIDGTLSLGGTNGGDLYLGGNWTRNTGAVFNHNDRMVIFEGTANFSGNGTSMSTIAAPASAAKNNEGGFGGENFAHIWINKTNAADSVVLLSNITVNREIGFTKGTFSLRNSDVTIVSNSTRTADVAPVNNTSNTSVRYGGTGRFVVQRFIHNPTGTRSWRLSTAPLQTTSAPTINEAFQEAVVNPNKNDPDGSGGIYNPWPGYGTHITGPGGAYNSSLGFDQGTSTSSILYGGSGMTSWLTPASTKGVNVTDQYGWMLFVRGDRSFVIGNQYVAAQNTILEPKGKINVGDVVKPIVAGKQIMGNPYASAISLMETDVAGTAGKYSTYYLWDPKMYTSYTQPGKWVTFTGLNTGLGFIQTTSESAYGSNGKIESGQAFVIDALSAGNFTFHESDKLPLNSSLVGITSGVSARPVNGSKPGILRSDMFVKNGPKYTLTDAVVNIFNSSFENNVDEADAKKMITFNTRESFSIYRDSVKLAIEKRADLTENDTIFFAIAKMNELPYQIRFTASDFTPAAEAYLEDNYTGLKTALNTSGISSYNFDITSDPLSKAGDRFRVVLKSGLGVVLPVTFTDVKATAQNKDIAVQWNTANEMNIEKYEVEKSIDGVHFETIHSTASAGNYNGNKTYHWLDQHAMEGINYYRIKSIDNNKSIQYSRVVKVNMAIVSTGIQLYANPVTNGNIKLQFKNMQQGKYVVYLMNSGGQLIFSKQIDHAGGTAMKNISPAQVLAKGIYHLEISSKGKEKMTLKVIIN